MANFKIEFSTKYNKDINIVQEQRIDDSNIIAIIRQESDKFILNIQGEKNDALSMVRSIWELASLYDGYFYDPENYTIDGVKQKTDNLYFLSYYRTGNLWKHFAMTLVGADKDFSLERITMYNEFRNKGRAEGQLCKSMINAFYYIHSKNYDGLNVNHRLSLLLNLCDGLAINLYGTRDNVKASVTKILKKTSTAEKIKYGASLLEIPEEELYNAIANERNEIDHYIIKEGSLTDYEMKASTPIKDHMNLYFTYVIEIAMRIAILKRIGCDCPTELIEKALDTVNDWVILECDIQVDCKNPKNKIIQQLRKNGVKFH